MVGFGPLADGPLADTPETITVSYDYLLLRSGDRLLLRGTVERLALRTASGATVVAVGTATETDTSFAIAASKTAAVGLASETDTSFAVPASKTVAVGLASETDTALPIVVSGSILVGTATETDTAPAISAAKTKAVGTSTETDTAAAITEVKSLALGLASESDTGLPLSSSKTKAVGTSAETDTALPIVASGSILVGTATESDSASAIAITKTVSVGTALETDAALPIIPTDAIPVGTATETDQALALSVSKTVLVVTALETDIANTIGVRKGNSIPVGVAEEGDSASPLGVIKSHLVGLAEESDVARPVRPAALTPVHALCRAIRNILRIYGGYPVTHCENRLNGQPNPSSGQYFISVFPGGFTHGGSPDQHIGTDRKMSVTIGITQRTGYFPEDRMFRDAAYKEDGVLAILEDCDRIIRQHRYEIQFLATNYLDQEYEGKFVEPPRLTSNNIKVKVVNEPWFFAPPAENKITCKDYGIYAELTYSGVRYMESFLDP